MTATTAEAGRSGVDTASPPPHDRAVTPAPPLWAVALAAGGGLAAWLAFPPYDQWYLMPVALAALGGAVLVRRRIVAALVGLVWGVAFFLPLTAWADIYAGAAPWVALAVFESLFIVLFALLARAVLVRRGLTLRTALLVSLLWAATETLRSHVPWGGLPWGATAFALQDAPLLSLGPWIGTAGLSVVVALLGQLLLRGAWTLLGRRGEVRISGLVPLAVVAILVLACLVVPRPHQTLPTASGTMRIAGIQGNTRRIAAQDLSMPAEILPHSLDRTALAAADARRDATPLDLVVWPEDSAGWDPRENALVSQALHDAAQDADAPILIGTMTDAPGDRIYNMSQLWTANGEPSQTYVKRHPVPFGEYIPARSFFRHLSDKVDLVPTDMAPGGEVGVMTVGERRVGVLICFEIAYDNLVRDVVDDGAQVIVVQTNTALFGESDEAAQQLGESRVLSAVSGRSIVQVATVGESAIVTPDGRVLSHAGHWTPGTVTADVPLNTAITPAMAGGPWIAVGIAALAVAGWCLSWRGGPRALADPDPIRPSRRNP